MQWVSNFERGKGSYFTVWRRRNRYTRSHQANYSKLTKRAWKLGNFLMLCFDFPLSTLLLWKKACIVEIFWYNSQYVIQLCWLVGRAECSCTITWLPPSKHVCWYHKIIRHLNSVMTCTERFPGMLNVLIFCWPIAAYGHNVKIFIPVLQNATPLCLEKCQHKDFEHISWLASWLFNVTKKTHVQRMTRQFSSRSLCSFHSLWSKPHHLPDQE